MFASFASPLTPISTDDISTADRLDQLWSILTILDDMSAAGPERLYQTADRAQMNAALARAYDRAPTITQRRFHSIAHEAESFVAAGMRLLINTDAPTQHGRHAAARMLAEDLYRALDKLDRLFLTRH